MYTAHSTSGHDPKPTVSVPPACSKQCRCDNGSPLPCEPLVQAQAKRTAHHVRAHSSGIQAHKVLRTATWRKASLRKGCRAQVHVGHFGAMVSQGCTVHPGQGVAHIARLHGGCQASALYLTMQSSSQLWRVHSLTRGSSASGCVGGSCDKVGDSQQAPGIQFRDVGPGHKVSQGCRHIPCMGVWRGRCT